jgi:hypothetical protein
MHGTVRRFEGRVSEEVKRFNTEGTEENRRTQRKTKVKATAETPRAQRKAKRDPSPASAGSG